MSRIGKLPITLPKGVTLAVDDNLVSIKLDEICDAKLLF